MKKLLMSIGLLILVGSMASTAWAQQGKGKGKKQMYSRNYNMNTIETIEGKITEVTYNPGKRNAGMMGVHVVVKTESESIPVHLGPVWYLNQQETLEKGDHIVVTGSRITYNDAPAIIAASVQRNQMTLHLRDQNGFPVWRGWRKGNGMNNR